MNHGPPPRRSDATRNRGLLVRAAREAFTAEGLHAPLDGVARRAGVSSGTLYRHFPSRRALVEEVFSGTLAEFVAAGERAMAVQDAWTALTAYLDTTFPVLPSECGSGCRGGACPEDAPSLAAVRDRHRRTVRALLHRGRGQGTIRPDVSAEDLLFALAVLGRALPGLAGTAPGAWRRPLRLLLDGLRAHPAATPLPASPLTAGELDAVLRPHRP
ncbi:TetR/AcrR family transcriptional regulator [Streptomyces rubrogriseus]